MEIENRSGYNPDAVNASLTMAYKEGRRDLVRDLIKAVKDGDKRNERITN